MKRLVVSLVLVVGVGALLWGKKPPPITETQFTSASVGVNSSGWLTLTFTEAGLTPGNTATYKLSTGATGVYGCISNNSKTVTDAQTASATQTVFASGTASSGGTISAGMALGPPPPSSVTACTGGKFGLAGVAYGGATVTVSGVPYTDPGPGTTLEDTTNTVSAGLSGCFPNNCASSLVPSK